MTTVRKTQRTSLRRDLLLLGRLIINGILNFSKFIDKHLLLCAYSLAVYDCVSLVLIQTDIVYLARIYGAAHW